MKQKHLYIGAIVTLLAMGCASCSDDFFETSSKTSQNSQTAFSNVQTAEMALIGCYNGWQRTLGDEGIGMYLTSEIASDECFAGGGVGDSRNYSIIDRFNMAEAAGFYDLWQTDWKNYYKAIFRCNSLIQNEANIDWGGDEVAHGRIIGEARGLRGLLYFDLVRLFGDVPLLTEPTSDNLPRTDVKDVYSVIFDDLKFAAANVPGSVYNGKTYSTTDGRMSKYAAEALLARAYLFYTGYYGEEHPNCTKQEAIDAVNDVVDNGGFQLVDNFEDLWMPACTEEAGTAPYAWKSTYAGKYYDGSGWTAGAAAEGKNEFVLNLKCNTTQDYNGSTGGNTFQVFLGSRNSFVAPYATGWGICVPNPRFVEKFDNPRMKHSVVDYAAIGFESQSDFSKCINDTYEYTGYGIKKYAPLCFSDGTREAAAFQLGEKHMNITYYIDYTIVRYADVLLMQSELTGDAAGLNAVQKRAGKAATAYSEDALRTERAQELAFEGIRYWELLRYGKGGSYAAATIAEMQAGVSVRNGGLSYTETFDQNNLTSKAGLMQIPNTEITLSGNVLTQNVGW